MRTGRMNEGVGGVPKLPASDDQSVHSPGLTGARRNNGAGRTKKKKKIHPGKVPFLPSDAG